MIVQIDKNNRVVAVEGAHKLHGKTKKVDIPEGFTLDECNEWIYNKDSKVLIRQPMQKEQPVSRWADLERRVAALEARIK